MEILEKELLELKQEMVAGIISYHDEFDATFEETLELAERFNHLKESAKLALAKARTDILPHLPSVSRDQSTLCSQVTQLHSVQDIIDHLIELHRHVHLLETLVAPLEEISESVELESIASGNETFDWESLIVELRVAEDLFKIELTGADELNAHKALHFKWLTLKGTVREYLYRRWKQVIKLELDQRIFISPTETCVARLQVSVSPSQLQYLVQGLEVVRESSTYLHRLGQNLWRHLLEPFICRASSVSLDCTGANTGNLQISLVENSSTNNEKQRDWRTPLLVISQLSHVLDQLNSHIFSLQLAEDSHVIDRLSCALRGVITESLLHECLARCVPRSRDELSCYSEVADGVRMFEKLLVSLKLADLKDTRLSEYVTNVETLFIECRAQRVLARGRDLLKGDLFCTRLIENKASSLRGDDSISSHNKSKETDLPQDDVTLFGDDLGSHISLANLRMPVCHVSLLAIDLLNLVNEVIEESSQIDSESSNPGPSTSDTVELVRRLFELYRTVVPVYNAEALLTIPQLAALHHNNCFYLAHHCLFLGPVRLAGLFPTSSDSAITSLRSCLLDVVQELRREGSSVFLRQMSRQRDLLVESLEQTQSFRDAGSSQGTTRCRQAFRQCLHHLSTLGRVWRVLPPKIYSKAMGTLCNTLSSDVINNIIQLEDITAKDCDTLVMLLQDLRSGIPPLFTNAESISAIKEKLDARDIQLAELESDREIQCWGKLCEMIGVLSGSLCEVGDRWASGKGPLADMFTAVEVKSLVRALYQNTEARATLLAKIG